jgi:hypothetical protein
MTDTPTQDSPATTAEIAAEIQATRAALGDTVAALAAKADVKARLAETGSNLVSEISETAGRVTGVLEALADRVRRNPLPWVLGAAAILITFVAARSRRR